MVNFIIKKKEREKERERKIIARNKHFLYIYSNNPRQIFKKKHVNLVNYKHYYYLKQKNK
jgi:hypothetical protein